jgi:hypothetical protein
MRGNTRLETETGTHKPLIAGSNPAAATSSSLLLLLGSCFLCRLRCRFSGGSPRVVGLASVTHIRDLLAYAIRRLYQIVRSFANTGGIRNAQRFKFDKTD